MSLIPVKDHAYERGLVEGFVENLDGKLLTEQGRSIYRKLYPKDKQLINMLSPFAYKSCRIYPLVPGMSMGVQYQVQKSMSVSLDLEHANNVLNSIEDNVRQEAFHHFVLSAVAFSAGIQEIQQSLDAEDQYPGLVKAWGWAGKLALDEMVVSEVNTHKILTGHRKVARELELGDSEDRMVVAEFAGLYDMPFPKIQKVVPWIGIAFPKQTL